MIWFNILFTMLIFLFSVLLIDEKDILYKKIYMHVLSVVILFFAVITYFNLT